MRIKSKTDHLEKSWQFVFNDGAVNGTIDTFDRHLRAGKEASLHNAKSMLNTTSELLVDVQVLLGEITSSSSTGSVHYEVPRASVDSLRAKFAKGMAVHLQEHAACKEALQASEDAFAEYIASFQRYKEASGKRLEEV